jgi:hypothetical protein
MTDILVFPQTMDTIMDKPGMTLTDYFAGQALAGIASDPTIDISITERAEWSYRMADAMLKARSD